MIPSAKRGDEVLADVTTVSQDGSLRVTANFKGMALCGTLKEVRPK
jgi:hypothetical protein